MPHPLGEFLRARRADVRLGAQPSDGNARRRVSGLRREEVSVAAGISVDYYTRLEQGREAHPSDAVLNALARALHLTPDATLHLFRLRETSPTEHPRAVRDENLHIARMTALVDAVRPNPAYVLDRLSNMVAANEDGLALFEGFADLTPYERNTCRYLLLDSRARKIFVEWEEIARGSVAHLRAANADNLDDPSLRELVFELRGRSAQFEEWWSGHIVEQRRTAVRNIRVGNADIVARRYEILHLPEDGLRMTLWLPAAEVGDDG
jgi:transcriptional regulator with XRE-family HTH domain